VHPTANQRHERMIRLLYTALLAGLMACSSGKTAYVRGDYAGAVQKASERLSQPRGWGKRGHQLAAEVVQRAFAEGYEQHQNTIRRLAADPQQPFRWEAIHAEYETLQRMTADAHRATANVPDPTLRTWLTGYPATYTDRLSETRRLAAADRYTAAETAFAHHQTDRLAARTAHEQYEAAQRWVPGYEQATQRSLTAFNHAVLRVLVEPPVATPHLAPDANRALGEAVFGSLVRRTLPSPYVHLYQPDQIEVAPDGTYHLMDGWPIHEVVQIAVSGYRPYDESFAATSRTIESTHEYKVGTKRINDSTVVDVMEKIRGTVTLHTHHVEARLMLNLRAIDATTDHPVWADTDAVSTDWVGQWETFCGDERALDSYTLKTLTTHPPGPADLLSSLISSAGNSVVGTLRQKYKRK
jgi:hypothetical protein